MGIKYRELPMVLLKDSRFLDMATKYISHIITGLKSITTFDWLKPRV